MKVVDLRKGKRKLTKLKQSLCFSEFIELPALQERMSQGKHLPWQSFYKLLYRAQNDGVIIDAECRQLLLAIYNSYTRFRQAFLGGVSLVPTHELWHCNNVVRAPIGTEQIDLLQLLADGELSYGFLNLLNEKKDSSPLEQIQFYDEKQSLYLQLFGKAHAEGLYELGTALLSLYLLYRAVILKGRLNLSPDMLEAINKALALPGAKVLKHTMAIAIESVEKYFPTDPIACCSAMILRQFIPQGAQLTVLPGKAGQEGARISGAEETKAFFMRELGADRWEQLSEKSQLSLVSAELQWKNSAHDFGFGITDWSGLIMSYCKAIEVELVDRLANFYASSELGAYLTDKGENRPAKATPGWLLKELKSYDAMPEPLQAILKSARIQLVGNINLIRDLNDIFQNYRNRSAHHDPVSMKSFADFKGKMFQSGLLHQFIDAFA